MEHLQGVKLLPYSQVKEDLTELISSVPNKKIWVSEQSSHSLVQPVPKARLFSGPSPTLLFKGVKNDTEIKGMRACQVRFNLVSLLCTVVY